MKEERAFPLILYYNYNDVIRPRGELLKTKKKAFDLSEAFKGADGRFCHVWKVDPEDLEEKKALRKKQVNDEKERLWVFVNK